MKNTLSGDEGGGEDKVIDLFIYFSFFKVCVGLGSLQPVASTLVNPPDNRSPSTQQTVFTFKVDGCIFQRDKPRQEEIKIVAFTTTR